MKRKLLLAMVALLSIVGVRQANAYTVSDLTDDGWEEVTSLPTSSSELGKYYYVFWETQADLMLGEENGSGKGGNSQENQLTGVYRTPADPATDKTKVWILEYSATHFYGIRNLSNPQLLLQSRENATYRVQAAWERIPSQWTQWGFTYADSKWSIQNKLPSNKGGGDNNWIGPWNKDAFQDNMVVAGNAGGNGNKKGLFKIYRKSRLNYDEITYNYASATAAAPLDVTGLIANANFSHSTTGWNITGEGPNAFNTTYTAFEAYHRATGLSQEIADLPNGVYKVTMQAAVNPSGTFYLFATSSNGTTKTPATVAPGANFNATAQSMSADASYAKIETYAIVTDGHLTIGHNESRNSTWPVFDNYTLTYYGAESDAYALALASEAAKANSVISALDASSIKTNMSSNYTSRSAEVTLENIQWMTFVASAATELNDANKLCIAAEAIAAVEYTETTSGSHATIASAITTFVSSVSNATATSTITTAISTLKAAIKAYVNAAEPKNDGEYFDITCLIENPTFENNNATGWSGDVPGFQSYQNAEFFNKNFDFYQNITGLANGSYQLSVQAFCRPGDNGNTTSGAYYDYTQGISNITAELYVNSDASTIGNIYSYKDNTTGAKVDGNDFHCNIDPDDYWVPNNMKGAGLYFEDGAYNTTVAALVEDGNLKIGFREENKKTNQWVIFDNFRLYYYGSSKLVYYKQYLPQLKAEVTADLSNGAYANVLVSSEDEALDAALAATPASETEGAYKTVIDGIKDAQTAFRAAAPSYDAMVAAKASSLTKFTSNIGTGIFQYNETTNNDKYSEYETAKGNVDAYEFTTSSTAAGAQTLVDALDNAIDAYKNQPLNAPTADTHYKLTLADRGALTYTKTGAADEGGYELPYQTAADYKAQTFFLNSVSGNDYTISFTDIDGNTRYICTGENAKAGLGNARIRTTTDDEKALKFTVVATTTNNVFNLLNTENSNSKVGSNGGGMYTADNYTSWSIAEASQAEVTVSAKAGKYGTIIFPFTPDVSTGFDGITFYSCNPINGESVEIEPIAGAPQANTPYIIKNTNGSDFSKDVSGWGTAAADSYADDEDLLTGIYTDAVIPENSYVLQTQSGVQSFYQVKGALTGVAYRAYLTVPTPDPGVKMFNIVDGTATGVEALEVTEAEEEEILYNTAGVRVGKDYKGIVINQKGEKRLQK